MAYPFRIATQLQYYVKCEKCKVNDVIFPFGFEARTINLGNKNVKIGIFTGGTSVRVKNIFTDISRYPTGKHEIKDFIERVLENVIMPAFAELNNIFQDDFNEILSQQSTNVRLLLSHI